MSVPKCWPKLRMYVNICSNGNGDTNMQVAIGMPEVPSVNGFVNGGLNQRPVFFGCNATATPATGNRTAPIIVYIPNYPWSYYGNVSTVSPITQIP